MLIAVEAQRIFRKHKHGMDVVALELCRELQKLDSRNRYVLLAADGPDSRVINNSPTLTTQVLPGFTYADWEQYSLPRALKKLQPDLLHCTANTAPLAAGVPFVLTLHDIIYLENVDFKGSAYQNFGNMYRRWIVPKVIKKARKIITVSEYEKNNILSFFPDVSARIDVIYNGVNAKFHSDYPREKLSGFRRRLQLPGTYILLLGNTAPKKNTGGAIEAYIQYHSQVSFPVPLVVADIDKKHALGQLRGDVSGQIAKDIFFPGYISPEEMPLLYNSAELFLYPSFRESFGMPLLEAMACSVPVITSTTAALPEIAGEAAMLIDPHDPAALAHAMETMLASPDTAAAYIQKGLARARQFSWENAAKKLLQVYEEAVRVEK